MKQPARADLPVKLLSAALVLKTLLSWYLTGLPEWNIRGAAVLRVGTGESPRTLRFYQRCGFAECGREAGFFTRYYDHPIVEDGVTLRDMIYLEKTL